VEDKEPSLNSHPETPVVITSARPSHSADIRRREIRYLLSMGIRTLCFVLAIVTTGPLRWVLVAAAVFLPYVAVVLANATDRRSSAGPAAFHADDRPQLEERPDSRDGR
jgi:Flp pilus assembly protein TadB